MKDTKELTTDRAPSARSPEWERVEDAMVDAADMVWKVHGHTQDSGCYRAMIEMIRRIHAAEQSVRERAAPAAPSSPSDLSARETELLTALRAALDYAEYHVMEIELIANRTGDPEDKERSVEAWRVYAAAEAVLEGNATPAKSSEYRRGIEDAARVALAHGDGLSGEELAEGIRDLLGSGNAADRPPSSNSKDTE